MRDSACTLPPASQYCLVGQAGAAHFLVAAGEARPLRTLEIHTGSQTGRHNALNCSAMAAWMPAAMPEAERCSSAASWTSMPSGPLTCIPGQACLALGALGSVAGLTGSKGGGAGCALAGRCTIRQQQQQQADGILSGSTAAGYRRAACGPPQTAKQHTAARHGMAQIAVGMAQNRSAALISPLTKKPALQVAQVPVELHASQLATLHG